MKETSKKVLKAAAIASLLTGSVIASTVSIFADKANAAPITAESTTGFTGTIDPSCAVATGFTSSTNAYDKTAYSSSGTGGVSKLEKTDQASFNCNSDTVNVSAAVTTNQPTNPTNATLLQGVHTTTLTNQNTTPTAQTANGIGATVAATSWRTDTQGNIGITVKSTWDPTTGGQELLDGTYTANAIVTVTPN